MMYKLQDVSSGKQIFQVAIFFSHMHGRAMMTMTQSTEKDGGREEEREREGGGFRCLDVDARVCAMAMAMVGSSNITAFTPLRLSQGGGYT